MKKLFCFIFFLSQSALARDHIDDDYRHLPSAGGSNILSSVYDVKLKQEPAFGNFFLKPALSVEYNAPRISESGVNSGFKNSGTIFHQIGDIKNIAIGTNIRVHKYWGINVNWVQSELVNSSLQGVGSLSERARFDFDQYNLSGLFYITAIPKFFEVFAEGGIADMRGKLTYAIKGNSVIAKSHETRGFYGAGFQIILNEKDTIRLSWQKYAGRIGLIDSEYSLMRVGYLMSF